MPTSDPIAEINTCMEAAVAAQEAGDYDGALRSMETVFMRISILPNSEFDNERLEWDRPAIKSLIDHLKGRVASQSAGAARNTLIRPNEITYERG